MDNENKDNANFAPNMDFTPVAKKKISKKMLAVIITAIIMIIVLTIYYFTGKKDYVFPLPTVEERSSTIESTVEETNALGLPEQKIQLDIMQYNLEN